MKIKTRDMMQIAIFTALTAILSQIVIPFAPVPINMAMLSVFIAGGLLGGLKGAISQMVYIAVGAIGVPVFTNFNSGVGALVGPTGGYIIGYVLAALIIGLLARTKFPLWIAMAIGLFACYTAGTAWFMILTKNSLMQSLMMCVVPFLIGDAIKIALAVFVVKRLKKTIVF